MVRFVIRRLLLAVTTLFAISIFAQWITVMVLGTCTRA